MLDPYAKTRITMEDVLAHSWLNPLPRKTSLQLLPVCDNNMKSRRQGISHSHSSSLDIRRQLHQECNQPCDCKCHKLSSEFFSHCEDCRPISDNLPSSHRGSNKQQVNGTLSVSSSGYFSTESLANSKHSPIPSRVPMATTPILIAINDEDDDCFVN